MDAKTLESIGYHLREARKNLDALDQLGIECDLLHECFQRLLVVYEKLCGRNGVTIESDNIVVKDK